MNPQKIIPKTSSVLGSLIALLGLGMIFAYIKGGLEDGSLFYWLLILLFAGISLTIFGVVLVILAGKAKTSLKAYRATKFLLLLTIILIIIYSVWGFYSSRNLERDSQQYQQNLQYMENLHKIKSLSVDGHNQQGFDLLIQTQGSVADRYLLEISAKNSDADFLNTKETVELSAGQEQINKTISYQDLFAKCFTELDRSRVYVCTANTGSQVTIDIQASLSPVQNQINPKTVDLTSYQETEIKLETFAQSNRIIVNQLK